MGLPVTIGAAAVPLKQQAPLRLQYTIPTTMPRTREIVTLTMAAMFMGGPLWGGDGEVYIGAPWGGAGAEKTTHQSHPDPLGRQYSRPLEQQ
jgi:hypothetical protein